MELKLDDEVIKMIEEYRDFRGDEIYAHHLSAKIADLYEEQHLQPELEDEDVY